MVLCEHQGNLLQPFMAKAASVAHCDCLFIVFPRHGDLCSRLLVLLRIVKIGGRRSLSLLSFLSTVATRTPPDQQSTVAMTPMTMTTMGQKQAIRSESSHSLHSHTHTHNIYTLALTHLHARNAHPTPSLKLVLIAGLWRYGCWGTLAHTCTTWHVRFLPCGDAQPDADRGSGGVSGPQKRKITGGNEPVSKIHGAEEDK